MALRNWNWAALCALNAVRDKMNMCRDDDYETACKGGIVFW